MARCRMWSWCSMPFRNTELQHWDIRNSLFYSEFLLMCQMMLFRPKNIFILIPIGRGDTACRCKGECERMKQAGIRTLHACTPPTGSAHTLSSSPRTSPSEQAPCSSLPQQQVLPLVAPPGYQAGQEVAHGLFRVISNVNPSNKDAESLYFLC